MPDPDEGWFQSPLRAIPLPETYLTRRRLLAGAGALATEDATVHALRD